MVKDPLENAPSLWAPVSTPVQNEVRNLYMHTTVLFSFLLFRPIVMVSLLLPMKLGQIRQITRAVTITQLETLCLEETIMSIVCCACQVTF